MSAKRNSRWHITRRCFVMIRRLQRGPATWKELVNAVQAEYSEAYTKNDDKSLKKQFHSDKEHLKKGLTMEIGPDKTYHYHLTENDYPLLDLPDADLTAIAWLKQIFTDKAPEAGTIHNFLDRVIAFLAPQRRTEIVKQRQGLRLDIARRDDNHIAWGLTEKIQQALFENRRVTFDYLSPSNPTAIPWRHMVDIYDYFADQGHLYIKGWCHEIKQGLEPLSPYTPAYQQYRLDRMSNLELLSSQRLSPPPRAKKHKVRYHLSAELVRRGVSRQRWIDFDDPDDLEWQPDGSVIVNGTTDNEFFAAQALMRYRDLCVVLNKGKVRRRIVKAVKKMAENYEVSLSE